MAYSYYRTITIDHTKCGSADSSNFPVLVIGTYSYLATVANGGKVQSGSGYDIQFFSDSALTTALKFERVNWTAATGACEFWVKVPTLSTSTDTIIYIAYGNASVSTDQQDAVNVWDANFRGVWHTNQSSSPLTDTTGIIGNLSTNAGSPSFAQSGKINKSVQLTTDNDQLLSGTNTGITGNSARSLLVWAYLTDESTPRSIIDFGNASYSQASLLGDAPPNQWGLYRYYGDTVVSSDIGTGAWKRIGYTYDGTTVKIWKDGSVQTTNAPGTFSTPASILYVGQSYNTSPWVSFVGYLEEIQLSDTCRSESWVLADYNNQNSPSTFYTVGSEVGGSVFIAAKPFIARQAVNRASRY